MLYRVVKLTDRRFLVARENIGGTLLVIAESRTEHSAHDVAKALNQCPQPEAVTAEAVAQRGIDRAFAGSRN